MNHLSEQQASLRKAPSMRSRDFPGHERRIQMWIDHYEALGLRGHMPSGQAAKKVKAFKVERVPKPAVFKSKPELQPEPPPAAYIDPDASIRDDLKEICARRGVEMETMLSRRRWREVVRDRVGVIRELRERGHCHAAIGRLLGRHHTWSIKLLQMHPPSQSPQIHGILISCQGDLTPTGIPSPPAGGTAPSPA